jgi:NADH-quinone oxidoreductase subunit N
MNFTDLLPAAPEMTLLGLICIVLLADLFVADEKRVITFWLTIAALFITGASLVLTEQETRTVLFDGSYVSDQLSHVLKLTAVGVVAVGFMYARDYLHQNKLFKGEYYVLGLFGLIGTMVMISANSLLTMYLGLETLSLSLYALVAFDRNSATAAESAMKFFVLGAIASGALLYGISWIYGITGSLQFHEISEAIRTSPEINGVPLWFGLAFVIVGIAFKFGAVPFHMWLPDVYQGARSPVALYIATAPKLAALALALRILVDGLGDLHEVWQGMIMVLAVLSLVIGNVVAIAQSNIKRMLGYSAIGHVGFILLAVFCGTGQGYAAALFYTLTYVVMAAGSFVERFQRPQRPQPVVRFHDAFLHVRPRRRAAMGRLFREAQCYQCRTRSRLPRACGADGAGSRRRRLLLHPRGVVDVLRVCGRPGDPAGQGRYALRPKPERPGSAGYRPDAGLALEPLHARPGLAARKLCQPG